MYKKQLFILVILASLIFLPTACKKKPAEDAVDPKTPPETGVKKGPQEAASASEKWQQMLATNMETFKRGDTWQSKGAVYVVAYHPQGQTRRIDEVDEINITFSQPVAPLEKVKKNTPSLISIIPAVKGEGFWKSSNTYCFRIDEPLKYSTRYQVEFNGYTSFSDKKVEAKRWSFATPTVRIIKSKPYNKARHQTLRQKIIVHLSQEVNPHQIKDFIKLTAAGREMAFSVRYSMESERKQLYYWTERYKKQLAQFITITAAEGFPKGSDIVVAMTKGLPSLHGNLGLTSERRITFRTYEEFKIKKISERFMADEGIIFSFTNPVAINQLVEKVTITPSVALRNDRKWTSREFHLYGKFRPGQTYKIVVPEDLRDRYGNRLGQQVEAECQALDYSTYFHPPGYNHYVLESYLEKAIPVSVRNLSKAEVWYKALTRADVLNMVSKGGFRYPAVIPKELADLKSYTWNIPAKRNLGYVLGFDLKQVDMEDPGAYYLSFEYRPYNRSLKRRRSLVQLTDTALVAKYSPSQIFLLPFNMKTGAIVPEGTARVLPFIRRHLRF